jgi:hypothetical protein
MCSIIAWIGPLIERAISAPAPINQGSNQSEIAPHRQQEERGGQHHSNRERAATQIQFARARRRFAVFT